MIHEVRFWDKDTPLDYEEFKLVFGSLFETNADIKRKFKDLSIREICYQIIKKDKDLDYDELTSKNFDELCGVFQETKYSKKRKKKK